ncbi:NAP-domain-containing protein [Coccomyxa subellipsoidea C-169]|uniref:NAP-domain-containing protein n=1 Tax=Coccomyxa subellipsoidea (strain C-169) TaxID=574566 RepID=I0YLS7_COCSC|nr:NAP-domain-containing protein [Coccomyxa subellipsoidea C-169]EIE19346.1 NAP-domain-containing protein [Coccomyxa subellipsoidea C-169]|eukprot:XP_005643890.1 NAP-domain-containing protein [Coccomyxa subellipsoidea C-169]
MSNTKRTKIEAATAEDAEEDQAAVAGDNEEVPLEGDADALGDLTGAEEAYEYDEEENEFLAALADVQDKLSEVNDEASDKVLQIEQEYNLKRQPIYKERNEIIRQMPDFWHEVFRGHEAIRPVITAEDEEGLAHLQEVSVEDAPDIKSGFKIVFTFLENRFFRNTQLEKNISYLEDGTFEISSAGPQWHAGQSLTEVAVYEGGKPTGSKRKRGTLSFFAWLEGDVAQETELQIAEIIKEQIWPNPLAYYHNPVAQSDDVAIELLDDDDDEEEYEGDEPYIFDEHGNPIQAEYVAVDGEEYQEGEGAEEYYEGEEAEGEYEEEGAEGAEEHAEVPSTPPEQTAPAAAPT